MTGNIDRLFYNHQLWKYIFSPSNRCFPQKTNKWKLIAIEQSLWWWWWWIIPNEKQKQKNKNEWKMKFIFNNRLSSEVFLFFSKHIWLVPFWKKRKEKWFHNHSMYHRYILVVCVCVKWQIFHCIFWLMPRRKLGSINFDISAIKTHSNSTTLAWENKWQFKKHTDNIMSE